MLKLTKYEKLLAVMLLLTLSMVRPWIHGDGRGYYAFARALLLQHNLDFSLDWYKGYETHPEFADPSFRQKYLTPNGHIDNHWTIGPAILWSPFLFSARLAAKLIDGLTGRHLAQDGFSLPYMLAVALGTFVYGALALFLSMRFASKYIEEKWVFLATLGIWLATSFTFYFYFEPSFAHTVSAFLVALFVYLWDRSREDRTALRWLFLGVIAGLMLDTYYPNAILLLLPFSDSLAALWKSVRARTYVHLAKVFAHNLLFASALIIAFVPTLITKKVLYGSLFYSGYKQSWYWNSPAFFKVCFSSHGLFSWTPILLPALLGLFLLRKSQRALSFILMFTVFAFIYFIGCYQDWHAIPSFGNRFFISLSTIFILGLAALLNELTQLWKTRRIFLPVAAVLSFFVFWNFGLMFQFAAHLFPQTGDVSWTQVAYNQFAVVPVQAGRLLKGVVSNRSGLSVGGIQSQAAPSPPSTSVHQ
jgi:hypothetical protein